MIALLGVTLGLGQLYISGFGGTALERQRFNGLELAVPRDWTMVVDADETTWRLRDPDLSGRRLQIARIEDPEALIQTDPAPGAEAEIEVAGRTWQITGYEHSSIGNKVHVGVLAILPAGETDHADAWIIGLDETARIHQRHADNPRRRAEIRRDRLNENFSLITRICRSARWPD